MSIAERIRRLRQDRGLTLKELAEKVGVHFTTVSSWERGRSMPGYEVMPRLAAALDADAAEMFGSLWGKSRRGGREEGLRPLPPRSWEGLRDDVDALRFLAAVEQRRRLRGLGEAEVAAAAGIDPERLGALLAGRSNPELLEAIALAGAVGLRIGPPGPEPETTGAPERLEKRLGALPEGVRRGVRRLFSRLLDWIVPPADGA